MQFNVPLHAAMIRTAETFGLHASHQIRLNLQPGVLNSQARYFHQWWTTSWTSKLLFGYYLSHWQSSTKITPDDCTVKSLTAYFTANRAGPIDFGNITGLVGWVRHWPMYADKFKWKDCFQLLTNNNIDKTTRTTFWKLLHRSHHPTPPHPTPYTKEHKTLCSMYILSNSAHRRPI